MATLLALRRAAAALRRNEAARARMDTRDWVQARRARTRELIELGGLVQKSGLPELVAAVEPDAPAVILGALLDLVEELRESATNRPSVASRVTKWRDRGRKALRASASAPGPAEVPPRRASP